MKRFLLFLALSSFALAAIPADSVWQVQTASSSDSNGGCWSNANKGATGVDHSQGAGTTYTSTLSAVGTTALTDSGAGFLNTMLGNCINIAGQGTYAITAFTSSTVVTVDRTLGTFSTTSGHEGGPILSLGHLCGLTVNGNVAYFKADGTFTITSATANADAGTCSNTTTSLLVGYTSNRTVPNSDGQPTIQTNVSTATMFAGNASFFIYNFILDGNTQTASKPVNGGVVIQSTLKNFNTAVANATIFYNVFMTTNSAAVWNGGANGSICYVCVAVANTATPFVMTTTAPCLSCISRGNTGGSTDGFAVSAGFCFNCTADNNGRDGFHLTGNGANALLVNTYSEGNASGSGYNLAGTTSSKLLLGLGYQGNMTAITNTAANLVQTTAVAPNASAFASSTNLNLNATAGAGALLRGTALPATFPDGTTTNFRDMNAAQHADPANVTVGVASVQ